MAGILPDNTAGGVIVRNTAGTATNPPNVQNAYIPPATFLSDCQLTALPSDCTAKLEPKQLNAIVSELLCFAVRLDPDGPWTCANTCNVSAAFAAWYAGTGPGSLGAAIAGVGGGLTGSVAASPGVATHAAISTQHFGGQAEYLGTPTRWISFTVAGVPGTVTIPSYT
jgi:hypothetical protein